MLSAARKATWLPLTAAPSRRTPAQTRLTAAVDQPSSLRAHWNSRARIAKPSGMTTMLVPGIGTTRSATPKTRTLNPAIAMATLRTPGVTRVGDCVPGLPGRLDISVRRICMIRLLPSFRAPRRHGLVIFLVPMAAPYVSRAAHARKERLPTVRACFLHAHGRPLRASLQPVCRDEAGEP